MPAVREIWAEGPRLHACLLRHWLIVLLAAVTAGAVTYVVTAAQDPEYEAEAELVFSDFHIRTLNRDEAAADPVRQLSSRISQIDSTEVLERAAELLGDPVDAWTLRESVWVWGDPDRSDSAWIFSRAGTADDAAAIANAVGEAYQEVMADQERARVQAAIAELDESIRRMEQRVEELRAAEGRSATEADASPASLQTRIAMAQLVDLSSRRERLEAAAVVADSGVASFQPAFTPWEPRSPRPRRSAAVGALFGFAFASAGAYWWEGRGLARRAADVRARLDVPLLAELPRVRNRRWPSPNTSRARVDGVPRAYEFLAVALDRTLPERPVGSVVFAAVRARRGDAAVALDSALALCQEHRRVFLVDANVRDRKLTQLWRLGDSFGLADLANPAVSFQLVSTLAGVTGGDGTWTFVPAGSGHTDPIRLRASAVQRLLQEVEAGRKDGYSVRVVLHGPPVLEVADVSAIARLADGVVLEVFARTKLEDVERAADTIELAGGRLLGFVFVGGRSRGGQASAAAGDRQHASRPRSASVS